MTPVVRAVIDTQALRENLARVREVAPKSQVMAVIKANAYGHGSVPSAVALAGAHGFAVARLEEGIALRAAGLRHRILLLEGVFGLDQLREAAHYGFDVMGKRGLPHAGNFSEIAASSAARGRQGGPGAGDP